MNISTMRDRIFQSAPSVMVAIALIMPVFILSCSDSEHRIPPALLTTRVILDLGGSSGTGDGPRMASAPIDLLSISISVAGPGMMPISLSFTAPFPDTIQLSVPSGPARAFTAVAVTPDTTYLGTAVANLPAGETVSVPIIMTAAVFTSEGTPDEPILIPNDGTPYIGRVGTGRSYYRTDQGSFNFLNILITEQTDDADLLGFAGDSTFSDINIVYPVFGANYCGRGKDESINSLSHVGYYYFIVDGSHTSGGAVFVISCMAHNGMVGDIMVGSIVSPIVVPVGIQVQTGLRDISVPPYINYYTSAVVTGTQYWINLYGNLLDTVTTAYRDATFSTIIGGTSFTAAGKNVFFTASGSTTDNFDLEVTATEGTPSRPVTIYPDELFGSGRANYCMVGGEGASSYYRMPVNFIDAMYEIMVTDFWGDVDLFVYDSASFDEPVASSETIGNGVIEEAWGDLFPEGCIYIRVVDMSGTGSTFKLSAIRTM
ncbi:MAG: hypothetical protein JW838_08155 [Spirochaetes bacterium]|nr:hypothetical protein [Spirochaetota bacterium]